MIFRNIILSSGLELRCLNNCVILQLMKFRVIVVGVIEKEGKILLGKKPENIGPYPNTLHIPGGGVDLDKETLVEALKREMKEEAGIEINNIEPIGFDEDYEKDKNNEMTHYVFLSFHATCDTDVLTASDDMKEMRWFMKYELKNLNLNKPSQKLLKKLGFINS